MDLNVFESSIESLSSLVQEYQTLDKSSSICEGGIGTGINRLKIC